MCLETHSQNIDEFLTIRNRTKNNSPFSFDMGRKATASRKAKVNMAKTSTGNDGSGGNVNAPNPPARAGNVAPPENANRDAAANLGADQAEAARTEAEREANEKLERQKESNKKKWDDLKTAIANAITPAKLIQLKQSAEGVPPFPNEKVYKPEVPIEKRTIPYNGKKTGLGISLFRQFAKQEVQVITTTNDAFRFNEPRNYYALKVVTEVCGHLHATNTRSEIDAFKVVILKEINEFASKGDFPEVTKLQRRHGNYLWHIWKGFNTDGTGGNANFVPVLAHYAEIRLGITPGRFDEVGAMAEAIIRDYLTKGKAGGDIKAEEVRPSKNWVYPILHAINLHIHFFTNLPKIVMSDEAETDRKLKHSQRMLNTSFLNIDYHGKCTEAGIE